MSMWVQEGLILGSGACWLAAWSLTEAQGQGWWRSQKGACPLWGRRSEFTDKGSDGCGGVTGPDCGLRQGADERWAVSAKALAAFGPGPQRAGLCAGRRVRLRPPSPCVGSALQLAGRRPAHSRPCRESRPGAPGPDKEVSGPFLSGLTALQCWERARKGRRGKQRGGCAQTLGSISPPSPSPPPHQHGTRRNTTNTHARRSNW